MSEQNFNFYKMFVSVPKGNPFGIQVPASSLNEQNLTRHLDGFDV